MTNFLNPRTWLTNWTKRYSSKSSQPICALDTCMRAQSVWQRLRDRNRPNGTLLQGAFYCQPGCLEVALVNQLSRLRVLAPSPQPSNRIPLGLLMVARGKLSFTEVRAALEAQRRSRSGKICDCKIGEWIEKLGFATEQDVTTALALQWGCPVATSVAPSTVHSLGNIPLPILEAFQMLPLNYASTTNTLYVAFGERVDHAALYAIEKTLTCRTQPCVAGRKTIARQLEAMRQLSHPTDFEFGPMNDLAEMARIAASYTARLSPEEVRLSRVGRFIWLRLEVRPAVRAKKPSTTTNLVFRLPTNSTSPFNPTYRRPTAFAPQNI
jgi:hypothetical protein